MTAPSSPKHAGGNTAEERGPVREWATFDDPVEEGRRWLIDVTFLMSSWECIYGNGCQGTLTELAPEMEQGCCSYGAHFADRKDRERTIKMSKRLTDDDWQFAKQGRARGIVAQAGKDGQRTRLIDDACIFLNRPDFPGGAGCAFHRYALRVGVHFSTTKPEICWQLPLRRDDETHEDGSVTSRLTEFSRASWGGGGDDFAWWCTEAPEAFAGKEPVYRSMEHELRAMLGETLYEQVAAHLARRAVSFTPPVPHPARAPVRIRSTRGTGRKR